jgi:hypothetical protein
MSTIQKKTEVKRRVSWGRPRPTGAVVPMKKKKKRVWLKFQ